MLSTFEDMLETCLFLCFETLGCCTLQTVGKVEELDKTAFVEYHGVHLHTTSNLT